MAKLDEAARRASAEDRVLKAAIRKANREEREARDAAAAALKPQDDGAAWQAETKAARNERLRRERAKADRLRALKRRDPAKAMVDEHVDPAAQQHGDYAPATIAGPIVVRDGEARMVATKVVRNRGGTAIERWHKRGDLTGEQLNAIQVYGSAHRLWLGSQRVTANWSLAASSAMEEAGGAEHATVQRLAAKKTLQMLDEEVFLRLPLHYGETWQNVVVFDEAAGVAGSRLGYRNDGAEAAAKAIVILIADQIALAMRARRRR